MVVINTSSFKFKKFLFRQIILAYVGFLQGVCAGGMFGFTSILFAQLKTESSIVLNSNQESWIASIPTLLMFVSSLLNCLTLEKFGRRFMMLSCDMINLTGWLLIYFASDYAMLLSGRVVLGIYGGAVYSTFITFLGEVSMPQYRSLFLAALTFGNTVGTLIVQLLGEYVHWKHAAAAFAFIALNSLATTMLYLKDSYVTHLDRNKVDVAQKCFVWYRGSEIEASKEFDEVLEDHKRKTKESFGQLLQMCTSKTFLMPLGITALVFLTNEFTATQAVSFYTSQIIDMIKEDPNFHYYAILALNILRIVAVILSFFLVKLTSVRFILISSGFILGVSLLFMGLFMYLSLLYSENTIFPIVTLFILVLNTMLYGIGLGPLPSVVCGEMFPQSTRAVGGGISASISFLFLFIVVKFMPVLFEVIGSYWTFIIFGVCTILGIGASHLVLPNTKNKTLLEISKLY